MSSFSLSGGTTFYIKQSGSNVEYSYDNSSWSPISVFPVTIQNLSTSSGYVTIEFITDITLTTSDSYFICGTSYLQFGKTTLNSDGTRPKITIDGVTDYLGLIENGNDGLNGQSYINIDNIEVLATNGSTLKSTNPDWAGWIGQSYYGKGANNNNIRNCSTDGDIPIYCGGLVGAVCGSDSGAELTITGCYSTGAIGSNAGGIIAISGGAYSGSVIIDSCWSSGDIDTGGGGITGNGTQFVTITNCYSTGIIGQLAGGICGSGAGRSGGSTVTVSNCYSTGSIGEQGGGIFGLSVGTVNISNCYSTGNMANSQAGGICGVTNVGGQTISNCYVTGTQTSGTGYIVGSQTVVNGTYSYGTTSTLTNNYSAAANSSSGWNDTNAKSVLTGYPTLTTFGTTWIQPNGTNTAYLLTSSAYSPYSYSLLKTFTQSIEKGESTTGGVVAGYTYSILAINGVSPSSYDTISIDSTTGVISTTSSITSGVYTIMVYSTKNPYSVTQFLLTILGPIPPTPSKKKKKKIILYNNTKGTTTIINCKKGTKTTVWWCK